MKIHKATKEDLSSLIDLSSNFKSLRQVLIKIWMKKWGEKQSGNFKKSLEILMRYFLLPKKGEKNWLLRS